MFVTELLAKLSHLSHLSLLDDGLLMAVPLIFYLVRAVIKPSKIEAEVLTRLLIPVAMALLKTIANYQREHSSHIAIAKQELFNLKSKLGRKALG
jgi:hypothetical protein